ncbi:hypothetical protein BGX38DRAFT_215360 [Terfezia claveryi]|nr:hypothetical protein BGX38DRAFT_215360 [Terfezia claveryi]
MLSSGDNISVLLVHLLVLVFSLTPCLGPRVVSAYSLQLSARGKTCFFEDLLGSDTLSIRFDVDEPVDEFSPFPETMLPSSSSSSSSSSSYSSGTNNPDIGFWIQNHTSPDPPRMQRAPRGDYRVTNPPGVAGRYTYCFSNVHSVKEKAVVFQVHKVSAWRENGTRLGMGGGWMRWFGRWGRWWRR